MSESLSQDVGSLADLAMNRNEAIGKSTADFVVLVGNWQNASHKSGSRRKILFIAKELQLLENSGKRGGDLLDMKSPGGPREELVTPRKETTEVD